MHSEKEFQQFLSKNERKVLFPVLIWVSFIIWLVFLIASFLLGGLKFGWKEIGNYLVIFLFGWLLSVYFFKRNIHIEAVKYIDGLLFIFLFTYLIFFYQEIWPVFFLGYILLALLMGISYDPKGALFFGIFSLFSFSVPLLLFENTIFQGSEDLIPIGISLAILSIGIFLGSYESSQLRGSMWEIFQKERAIKEMNTILEIRIRAKTRQLQEQAEVLKKEAKEKTREIEVKGRELQQRVEELEEFQKLTVGRELKMAELKEEIERLKRKK